MRPSYDLPRPALAIWTGLVVFFMLAPLLVVFLVSVTPLDRISLPQGGISFRWFRQLAERQEFLAAAFDSLLLAAGAAATAVLIGTLASIATVRYSFRLKTVVTLVVSAPLFIPMVMSGLAVLVYFSSIGLYSQPFRLYVAHTALTLPYVIRTVSASLSGFDPNQELAARNLGASPLRAFLEITLPQIRPGIFAGSVFAFIVSFDNVGVSIFLTGSQFMTLPVQLFSYTYYNNDPMASAAAVVMILFSFASVALVERFFGLQRLMR